MAIEKMIINPRLEHHIIEKVKKLFTNEDLEKQSTSSPPSDIELTISLKHDRPISYRLRKLSYSDKQKL